MVLTHFLLYEPTPLFDGYLFKCTHAQYTNYLLCLFAFSLGWWVDTRFCFALGSYGDICAVTGGTRPASGAPEPTRTDPAYTTMNQAQHSRYTTRHKLHGHPLQGMPSVACPLTRPIPSPPLSLSACLPPARLLTLSGLVVSVAGFLSGSQTAGGLLASVPRDRAAACVSALQQAGYRSAAVIGTVTVSARKGKGGRGAFRSCCVDVRR